jgi:hypothetical protein
MNPKIWGPHAWVFLHTITLNFPENPTPEQKKYYKDFFESLIHIIPCDKCRYNYMRKIKEHPVKVETRMDLVQWLLNIHNDVNKSNGKEELTLPNFIKKYRDMYSYKREETIDNQKEYIRIKKEYLKYTLLILLLILFYSFFIKKK